MALCVLINNVFLERIYSYDKKNALVNMYYSLYGAAASGTLKSDDFDIELLTSTNKDGIGVIVMDTESRTVKSYAQDPDTMEQRMWDNLLDIDSSKYRKQEQLDCPVAGQTLQRILDERTNTEFLEMWGILPDGSFYLLRTPLESIVNSTRIANSFLLRVGIAASVIGAIAAFFLARRIIRPIEKLNDISKRMRELDFSAKYEGKDRTEIAELGENMNELSAALKQTISDLKTANYKLTQDIEERNRLDSVQREFISGVTHELKTPIALIRGYAEGLEDDVLEDPESRAYYVSVIQDEASKMNSMVQKMLELSHIEFGQENVRFEQLDISEMIRDVIEPSLAMEESEGITVEYPEEDQVFKVWSDPFLIEQVFQNYFSNARHYCLEKSGRKKIEIHCLRNEESIRVTVFNTGDQIPEESIPRLWDRFIR